MEEMTIFVDSSVLVAFLDKRQEQHDAVVHTWRELGEAGARLVTTNYVVLETFAVLQRRLGLAGVVSLATEVLPSVELEWVDPDVHDAALEALLLTGRRELGLVDYVSFVIMHRLGLRQAFTLDPHFREQGFECLPPPSAD